MLWLIFDFSNRPKCKGGLHLGKPIQVWISKEGAASQRPPDPDFLHSRFQGGRRQGQYIFEIQILFWLMKMVH